MSYILQGDNSSKIALADASGFLTQGAGMGGPTDYTDSAIISIATSVSGVEVAPGDSATLNPKTTPSGSDLLAAVGSATISGLTTISALEEHDRYDAAAIRTRLQIFSAEYLYQDSSTVGTITTILADQSFSLYTVDYNWSPWLVTYTFDATIPVYGQVGEMDDDHGQI